MELLIKNIVLPFTEPPEAAVQAAHKTVSETLGRFVEKTGKIYKKSIDARKRDCIKFVYTVKIEADFTELETEKLTGAGFEPLSGEGFTLPVRGGEPLSGPPVIVGFGPCGMFCALTLARSGYRPVVLERGAEVGARKATVENFILTGNLDPETNIQFGEGGAGTFSDGKLVTLINDPVCRHVLRLFYEFGAPEDILCSAKPHIGTDRLTAVVAAMREEIIRLGGEILFNTRAEGFIYDSAGAVRAVKTFAGEIKCGAAVLATGHSARDTYAYLASEGFALVTKPFSVGARIEHLRRDIDTALYGEYAGDPLLGAGEYALSHRPDDGQAVYTFCMCPGGIVAAGASEPGGVVTNGMSRHARDGNNSNAALAVSVDPAPGDPLAAIEFQRTLERAAYLSAGDFYAPAQTVGDFIAGTAKTEPKRILPTYRDGRVAIRDLNKILPRGITEQMKLGITEFDKKLRGFACPDAVLTGVETRTSAPLRILRGEAFTARDHDNVYPCGEGAGYAGGITSAAADGLHAAIKIIGRYRPSMR